jgi:hypothetical protein
MPTNRKYTSRSQQTTLTSAVTSGGTTINVSNASTLFATVSAGDITGGTTFTVVLDPDTALEEIVEVTGASSNTLTITRSVDAVGTATDHSAGAVVRHMVIGRDLREANEHINATGTVHGLASTGGVVVGTAQIQTLTNKTLTTPVVAGATLSGTVTSTATITGGTLTGAIVTGLSAPSNGSDATTKTYVDSILGSAVAASTSATSAAASATAAATSATSAAASATAAATSATSAAASATAAATSATSAAASATAAATSAGTATTQATAAATSATSAAASASAAATSATSAAASATTAAASVAAIATYASNALTSANSAATSATAAATSAASASTSQTAAATSATSAAASATAAATSATSAAASATVASTSASSALTSQTAAATSATSAAASAAAAATSATAAATSATSSAASYTSYDQRYLGSKSSAPSLDNQGNALITGATYWNSTTNLMYAWDGAAWNAISTTSSYSAPTLGSTTIASGTTYANVNGLTINSTTIPTSKTLVDTNSSQPLTNKQISAVDSGTTAGTGQLFDEKTTGTISIGGGLTSGIVAIAYGTSFSGSVGIANGAGTSNKTINIGTGSTAGTTTVNLGSTAGATSVVNIRGAVLTGTVTAGGSSGTSGQALTSTASGIAWEAPIGMSFISTTPFTSVTSVSINNCFSATYSNYFITINTTTSGNTPTMKLRVSGTDSSANYYDGKISSVSSAGTTLAATVQSNVTTGWKIGNAGGQLVGSLDVFVKNPFATAQTLYNTTASYGSSMAPTSGIEINAGNHNASTSYDGFTLTFTGSTSGTIKVYGLRN